jgi:hypothetical protein
VKVYVVALLLVVGILGGFYGGYKIGHNTVSANTTGQTQNTRGGNVAGAGLGGGRGGAAVCPSPGAPTPSPGSRAVATGTITGLTSSTLTITNPNCDVKVAFDPTVQISRQVVGNTGDLKDTLTVTIVGTRQADGSIKATTIQIANASFNVGNQSPPPGGG